jgi:hypothetical protein
MITRDFYKVLIVGSSGQGKTYSFRNLDDSTTGFINVEDKPLPFKKNFKVHLRPRTASDVISALVQVAKDGDIKTIVIDSFSAYMDMVLAEARATKKGFDVWSTYNEEIAKFHSLIKRIQKEIFVTGHYEILNLEGASEKRLRVQGKENEGQVEKHYTIVMYADSKQTTEGKRPEHYFKLTGEGISAKCPPDIFGEDVLVIPNDAKFIVNKIEEFTK